MDSHSLAALVALPQGERSWLGLQEWDRAAGVRARGLGGVERGLGLRRGREIGEQGAGGLRGVEGGVQGARIMVGPQKRQKAVGALPL